MPRPGRTPAIRSRPRCSPRLLEEEHAKLLAADGRDVHDDSKATTLPIARAIVEGYVRAEAKPTWYIDLLNRSLGNDDLAIARERIAAYVDAGRPRRHPADRERGLRALAGRSARQRPGARRRRPQAASTNRR